jgi:hypothetical protein
VKWKPATLAFLLPACVTLTPEPFTLFDASVRNARTALTAALDRDVDWTREADVQTLANDPKGTVGSYIFTSLKGAGWELEKVPAHWEVRRTRRALLDMTDAFQGYAGLLVEVVSGQARDAADYADMADSLNKTLRAAAASAGSKDEGKLPAAGLSAGAEEALRRFTARRRAQVASSVMAAQQSWVEAFAARGPDLLGFIRADLKTAYADQARVIGERWDDKRSPGRTTLARSLFNMNEEYVDTLDTLAALEDFFHALPDAHRALAHRLEARRGAGPALTELARSAARAAQRALDLEKAR